MSDNILVTPGVGASIAADEIAGNLHQRIKITVGADGVNDGDVSSANPMPVVQTGTPALPTGAATETTLSALNTKVPVNLTVTSTRLLVDGSGVTQPISGSISVNEAGFGLTEFIRNDYSSVGVTTGAYVQLIASTSNVYKEIEIFDSSGQTLKLAFGAAAAEVDQMLIFPGGNGRVRLAVSSGIRISIRAVSANASVGEICINLYG